MIKRIFLVFITFVGVAILSGQSLASVAMPVSSAVNPASYRLYTIDNDPTSFKIKTYDTQNSLNLINTTAAITGLGNSLLVNTTGDRLYVAIQDGANSKIRAYNLNTSGDLTATYVDYALAPINGADCSPSGMALGGNTLYVADLDSQNIHVIDLTAGTISHLNVGALNMYDIVYSTHTYTTPPPFSLRMTVKDLYIIQGDANGKVIVYSSSIAGVWNKTGELTNVPYPRFIKAANKDLYISVKDQASKRHVLKYDITNVMPSYKGSVGAATFVDDWVSFDLNNDGSSLYYTWPQGNGTTKVYGVPTSQLDSGDKDIASVKSAEYTIGAQFDSLNVDPRGNSLAVAYSADGSAQKIALTSPAASFTSIEVSDYFSYWQAADQNAGLLLGSTYPISWRSAGPVGNVDLVYQTSDGTWGNIATNLANTGSGTYNWTVSGIAPGTKLNVYVRASSAPLVNKKWVVTFTVGSPITVTAPNGGQTFQAGDPVTITWNPAEITAFSKVKVLYTNSYSDGTQNWTETLPFANPYVYRDNSGTATWTIPAGAVAGSNYRIMVALGTTVGGQYVGSVNAGNFTVAPAPQLGDFGLLYPQNNTQTGTRPTFMWAASSNAVTYELHISDAVKEIAVIKDINGTSYQLQVSEALSRNTAYHWHVVAKNGSTTKQSTGADWNFITSAVDVAGSPYIYATSPADAATNVPRNQDVVVTFNEPIDQATFSYTIEAGTDPNGWTYLWSSDSKTVTLKHATIFALGNYKFSVSAKDTVGLSLVDNVKAPNPWSFSTRSSTAPNQAPSAPILIAPADGATVASPVPFSWQASTDPDDNSNSLLYTLEITSQSDPTHPQTITIGGLNRSVSLSNGSYSWHITARDPWGGAATSVTRTFTVSSIPVDTTAPAAITDLRASVGQTSGTVKIDWSAVADDGVNAASGRATSYTIYYQFSETQPANIASALVYTPVPPAAPIPTPGNLGVAESLIMDLGSANMGKKVWITIRAADEVPNISAQGNWAATIVKNNVPAPTITKVYPQRGPNGQINHIVIIGNELNRDLTGAIISQDGSLNIALEGVHQDSINMVQADIPNDARLVASQAGVDYEIAITTPGGTYDDAAHANPNNNFTMITPGTDTQAPAIVANFTASDDQANVINLRWTNPADNDLREIVVLRKAGAPVANHADAAATTVYQTAIPEPNAAITAVDNDANLAVGTTYYYAVFSRDTSGNWNDAATMGSNEDTGTIRGGQTPTVTSTIGRNGSNIELNWTIVPSGPVDIYTVSGTFTTDPNAWDSTPGNLPITPEFANVSGTSQTDLNQVGTGTAKYYKIVPKDHVLTSQDLTHDVVGKFDLTAKVGQYSLVSCPIISTDLRLNNLIGDQMNKEPFEFSADLLYYPNSTGGFDVAWLKDDGSWYKAGSETDRALYEVSPDKGFYLFINNMPGHTDKKVTIVGSIESASQRTQTISQGFNMVGSPYPIEVSLAQTGLAASGLQAGDAEFAASVIYIPKADGSEGFDTAWLKTNGMWYDAGYDSDSQPGGTLLKLKPGIGYYLNDTDLMNPNPNFNWSYPKPY